ncbi:hypothetical protein F5146DRAFT_749209 [Armillaria mellea]|nr:hypothetical protein F5146DRAFT_749209 [Armillaria mellea]
MTLLVGVLRLRPATSLRMHCGRNSSSRKLQRRKTTFVVCRFRSKSLRISGLIRSSALYERTQTVQKEVDKLTSGNETLQMYIDNLTVQMAKRR